MDLDKILYGGDYNPEQWLDQPDILEEDIAMMQEAHINTVTLGVFSWSTLEQEEGKYNFDWLDRIMDRLDQAGISVILATPSGARPQWMAEKYPEVLRVNDASVPITATATITAILLRSIARKCVLSIWNWQNAMAKGSRSSSGISPMSMVGSVIAHSVRRLFAAG